MSPEQVAVAAVCLVVASVWLMGVLAALLLNYGAHGATRASRDEWDAWLDLEVPSE